ncbi:unnamed protein product [Caretta caretta]
MPKEDSIGHFHGKKARAYTAPGERAGCRSGLGSRTVDEIPVRRPISDTCRRRGITLLANEPHAYVLGEKERGCRGVGIFSKASEDRIYAEDWMFYRWTNGPTPLMSGTKIL